MKLIFLIILIIVAIIILVLWLIGNSLKKILIEMENEAEDAYWLLHDVEENEKE